MIIDMGSKEVKSSYTIGAVGSLISGSRADTNTSSLFKPVPRKKRDPDDDELPPWSSELSLKRTLEADEISDTGASGSSKKSKKKRIAETDDVNETSLRRAKRKRISEDDDANETISVKKRKNKDESISKPEESQDEPKSYTKPSLKFQVLQEDRKSRQMDPEVDARTIFVGNLPANTKKKQLKQMFSKFGAVESVRFRCAARPDMKTTKKVAVIKRTLHEGRNNINAYVCFSNRDDALKSLAMNGKKIDDDFVIRVDSVGQPAKRDPKKAIFIGNLTFNTEENAVRDFFSRCGRIEDVRLIRDSATGVGKGFGYVNFKKSESVELALQLNKTALNGRPVRLERCVKKTKVAVPMQDQRGRKKRNSSDQKVRKITRKEHKEKQANQFQGTTFESKAKAKKKVIRKSIPERKKKKLSAILSKP